uniref:Uncharacterized protein n=1 Tax=Pavo cristatus TaxID=9049 RepID=A0A8C9F7A4_PAVCR
MKHLSGQKKAVTCSEILYFKIKDVTISITGVISSRFQIPYILKTSNNLYILANSTSFKPTKKEYIKTSNQHYVFWFTDACCRTVGRREIYLRIYRSQEYN